MLPIPVGGRIDTCSTNSNTGELVTIGGRAYLTVAASAGESVEYIMRHAHFWPSRSLNSAGRQWLD
jgi:hypothetical protein